MAFYLIAVAGGDGRPVLSGRGRFRRRDATDDLRRRHAGAVDLRRDAHGPGPVHLDEDRRPATGCWAALVGGSLLAVLLAGRHERRRLAARRGERAADGQVHRHAAWAWACSAPRVDKLDEPDPVQRAGMSGYLLPFEIISVHLLVVLIGAAYLARPKKRAAVADDLFELVVCVTLGRLRASHEPADRTRRRFALPGRRARCCSSAGAVCMATKRNALGVLMGIELVLNGANVNFVAFGSAYLRPGVPSARARRPVDRAVRDRAGRGRSRRGPGHHLELLQQPRHDRRRSGGRAERLMAPRLASLPTAAWAWPGCCHWPRSR